MTTKLHKGLFIVFEGLDRSGSSTQVRLLHEKLTQNGYSAIQTAEPTSGPVGNLIKLSMSHRLSLTNSLLNDDKQLAYLFAADRFDHLYNKVDGVIKMVEEGRIVISSRYYLSSYAYHCNSEADFDFIYRLNQDFPPPDLTFFLNIPLEESIRRIRRSRIIPEKYEIREKLEVVKKNYEKALKKYQHRLIILDAMKAPGDLLNEVYSFVEGYQ
jgi:dTMP kinase